MGLKMFSGCTSRSAAWSIQEARAFEAPVIDHFGARPGRAVQEDLAHAEERLSLGHAGRGIESSTDPPRKVALAAQPWGDRRDRINGC